MACAGGALQVRLYRLGRPWHATLVAHSSHGCAGRARACAGERCKFHSIGVSVAGAPCSWLSQAVDARGVRGRALQRQLNRRWRRRRAALVALSNHGCAERASGSAASFYSNSVGVIGASVADTPRSWPPRQGKSSSNIPVMQGTRRARIKQRGWYAHIRLRSPPVPPDVAPVGPCAGSTRLYSARS